MPQRKANKKSTGGHGGSGSAGAATTGAQSHDAAGPDSDEGLANAPGDGAAPIDAPSRRRLPPLLRLAWYSLNQAFRRRIHHLNITPDQFTILRWLTECDPDWPTQRELGAMMASDPNTITSLLRRMEVAAFVERQPHETDKRANRIKITAGGKKVYLRARQIAIDLQGEVLLALPETRRDQFFADLESLAHACRKSLGSQKAASE